MVGFLVLICFADIALICSKYFSTSSIVFTSRSTNIAPIASSVSLVQRVLYVLGSKESHIDSKSASVLY